MTESVLLIGNGGREHALAHEMSKSEELDVIYCAPGNTGTDATDKAVCVDINPNDIGQLTSFARDIHSENEHLTVVVGPGNPLTQGLADRLRSEDIPVCGPGAKAARLESSKIFATRFMEANDIPHPASLVAHDYFGGVAQLRGKTANRWVLKADGLADGKGVVLPRSAVECRAALYDMLAGKAYDGAGERGVVLQERLTGPEVSVFALSDGKHHQTIPYFAQDHKRLQNGDYGPNTGGMGAYAPVPDTIVNNDQRAKIEDIVARSIEGMSANDMPYKGVLYLGIILAEERGGDPVVLEYNARFGDPEAQVVLPLLTNSGVDVYAMLRDNALGKAPDITLAQNTGRSALTVCLASKGYPDAPHKGDPIHGLGDTYDDVIVHHGATMRDRGRLQTGGGRVLYITGQGESVPAAARAAYAAIGAHAIHFDGMQYRNDIGHQAR